MSAPGERRSTGTEVAARKASARQLESRATPRAQLADIQRSRLLAATVAVIQGLGYERTTVAQITRRAGVSRRTFYELFTNREECIACVLRSAASELQSELEAEGLPGLAWRERMRLGLWKILCFLDRQPELARVALIDTQRGSGPVLAEREALIRRLVAQVDEARAEKKTGAGLSELTAEGVLGATLAIVSRDLTLGGTQREWLTRLFPELIGIVLLPYEGPAVARREQARPAPAPPAAPGVLAVSLTGTDPLAGLQMRLTYRTARVLEGIGEHPGASNRQAADYAGIADQGQMSKLLARLERLGLLANHGEGQSKGEPNAWSLTAKGQLVTQGIRAHTPHERRAA